MGKNNEIDVICQHSKDGTIIPIKIRIQDEEKQYQTYTILSYMVLSGDCDKLPNEVIVTANILRFVCKINVFGCEKKIVLHYNKSQTKWFMYY